jgi:hypothetical protein
MCTEGMCRMKVAAILTELASLSALVSDSVFQTAVTSVFGHDGPKIMGCIAIVGILSAKLLHWLDDQPPNPFEPQTTEESIRHPLPPTFD